MCEMQHTIVCSFDTNSPRISALQIHESIHEGLKLSGDIVRIIQIDWPKLRIFIKLDKMNKPWTFYRRQEYKWNAHMKMASLQLCIYYCREWKFEGLGLKICPQRFRINQRKIGRIRGGKDNHRRVMGKSI
jgi:hypothetical protein